MARVVERETVIGAATVLVGAAILALAYIGGGSRTVPGYDLTARFNKADGISIGSAVRLAGVDVGKVIGQSLDDRFHALLTLRIAPSIALPADSAALIETDGLLGAKFVALQPGADDKTIAPGGTIRLTQDSMNLSDILELIISQAQARRAAAPAAGR